MQPARRLACVTRLTKRGRVECVVREMYQRTDIQCRSPLCSKCAAGDAATAGGGARLRSDAAHYVMPDAEWLLQYLELLELSDWSSVIVLASVFDEFSRRAPPRAFHRLRRLLLDTRRALIVFPNQTHAPTFVRRLRAEDARAHSRRALMHAASWFDTHLGGRTSIVVLSADAALLDAHRHSASTVSVVDTPTYLYIFQGVAPHASALPLIASASPAAALLVHDAALAAADAADAAATATSAAALSRFGARDGTDLWELFANLTITAAATAATPARSLALPLSNGVVGELSSSIAGAAATLYPPHLDAAVLDAGVKSGVLFRGVLRVQRQRAHAATVELGLSTAPEVRRRFPLGLAVDGEWALNRAFHNDEVFVELLAGDASAASLALSAPAAGAIAATAVSSVLDLADADGDVDVAPVAAAEAVSDGVTAAASGSLGAPVALGGGSLGGRPLARVRGIATRAWRPYVCMIAAEDAVAAGGGEQRSHALCVPMDARIPKIRIATRQAHALAGERLVIAVDEWSAGQRHPSGHFVARLGPVWAADTETRAILIEHELSAPPYPAAVEAAFTPPDVLASGAPSLGCPYTIPASGMQGRRDLRATHCVVSVDPVGCTDIDDALSLHSLANGNRELGVHIADVSYFVRSGCAIDLEARARGTSVYMVDRRLDMLPRALAEGVASLHEGVDRCALSAVFEIDAHTDEIVGVWYGRTAIRNRYALTYAEAQAMCDERDAELSPARRRAAPELRPSLRWMLRWSRRLRAQRAVAGAVELDSFDQKKFTFANRAHARAEPSAGASGGDRLDDRTHEPTGVGEHEHPEVCSMIEQFMVLANVYVAERIYRAFPTCALLRRHPLPRADGMEAFERFAATLGVRVDTSSNRTLAASLAALEARAEEDEMNFRILKAMTVRAMSEAKYFSTGDRPESDFYHYGLAADFYTHFTSPIRRYADLVVHRLLLAAIDAPPLPPPFAASAPVSIEHSTTGALVAATASSAASSSYPSSAVIVSSSFPAPSAAAAARMAPETVALAAAFGERTVLSGARITHIADRLNDRNRLAKEAQRASQDLFFFLFLKHTLRAQRPLEYARRGDDDDDTNKTASPARELDLLAGRGLVVEGVVLELRVDGCILLVPQYLLKCVCVFVHKTHGGGGGDTHEVDADGDGATIIEARAAFAGADGAPLVAERQPRVHCALRGNGTRLDMRVAFGDGSDQGASSASAATYTLVPFARVRVALSIRASRFDYRRPPLVTSLVCAPHTSPLAASSSSAASSSPHRTDGHASTKSLAARVRDSEHAELKSDAHSSSDAPAPRAARSLSSASTMHDVLVAYRRHADSARSSELDTAVAFAMHTLDEAAVAMPAVVVKRAPAVQARRTGTYLVFGGGAGAGMRGSVAPPVEHDAHDDDEY